MKGSLIGLVASAAVLAAATAAELDIHLIEGHDYPVCVAVVAALRQMSPSTGLLTWPEHLPPIRGVTRPHWSTLDPLQYMQTIRDYVINIRRQNRDARSDEAIWADLGPQIERNAQSGTLRVQETMVYGVKLGVSSETLAQRPWTTDIRFIRISTFQPAAGTIGKPQQQREPSRLQTVWTYMAASFSLFPNVHNVPIEKGLSGLDLILVNGQPWFVELPSTLGIPYTNDLQNPGANADHRIYVDDTCTIAFRGVKASNDQKR